MREIEINSTDVRTIVATELFKKFSVEAARYLVGLPEGHKCSRMHGHTFEITITVTGPVDKGTGWIMDFSELHAAVEIIQARLDHVILNDVDGLDNPTTENLAKWIWDMLLEHLPGLTRVQVCENSYSGCAYTGK